MHRANISTIIFTHVFSPQYRASRLHSILFTLTTFYVIFILFPTPYLPRFCLVCSSILITDFELRFYDIFSPCSWHVARLGPNIFIFHSLTSIRFQFFVEYINPCFTMLCHEILSLAMVSRFHTVHPYQPQQRLILCTRH